MNDAHISEDTRVIDYFPDTIYGHSDLVLIPGNQYDIHYGIHQGRHIYVGRRVDDNDLPMEYRYEHLFRPVGSDEITFGYYGHTSPYEFTRIVFPVSA